MYECESVSTSNNNNNRFVQRAVRS